MCTCCRIWIKVLQRTDGGLTHVGKIPQGGALYIYQPPPPGFFEYYCYCTFDAHPRRGGTTSTPQPTPHNPQNRIGSRCKDKTELNVGRVCLGLRSTCTTRRSSDLVGHVEPPPPHCSAAQKSPQTFSFSTVCLSERCRLENMKEIRVGGGGVYCAYAHVWKMEGGL